MRIGIYSPYINTLGGGERYMLTFAEYCLQRDWQTELFWRDEAAIEKASERFDLSLGGLRLNKEMFDYFSVDASYAHKLKRWLAMSSYDLIFWLSDGSVPFLNGRQNWLHFQVPFQMQGNNFKNQYKLTKIHKVVCNSRFTAGFIDTSFGIKSDVIYPPVAVHDCMVDPIPKENIVLSVGRFDQIMNAKRQDVLIEAFKNLVDKGLKDWRLVLIGGVEHGEKELLKLRELAFDYPVDFRVNVSYAEVVGWYKKASIYWHAAGFEVNEKSEPQKVEHFGISIVEAMAAGCVPIVYKAGGVGEILEDKRSGYLWHTTKQLIEKTENCIKNLDKEKKIITNAQKRSLVFSREAFFKEIEKRLDV